MRKKRLNLLKKLGMMYTTTGKSEKAVEKFKEALKYCKTSKEKADILIQIGIAYQRTSRYPESLDYLNQALGKLSRTSPCIERANAYSEISWVLYLIGKTKEAITYAKKGLDEINSIEENEEVIIRRGRIYNVLASIYKRKGEEKTSYDYYLKALKEYQKAGYLKGMASIYNNLCGHYSSQGEFEKAIESLEKSLKIDREIGEPLGEAISTYNLGEEFINVNDLKKAKAYLDEYQRINKEIHNRLGEGWANEGYGEIERLKKNYSKAIEHFKKAIKIFREVGSEVKEYSAKMGLCGTLIDKNEIAKAIPLLAEIEKYASNSSQHWMLDRVYELKGDIFAKNKKWNKSAEYYKKAVEITEHRNYIAGLPVLYYKMGKVFENIDKKRAKLYLNKAKKILRSIISKFKNKDLKEKFIKKEINQKILSV